MILTETAGVQRYTYPCLDESWTTTIDQSVKMVRDLLQALPNLHKISY